MLWRRADVVDLQLCQSLSRCSLQKAQSIPWSCILSSQDPFILVLRGMGCCPCLQPCKKSICHTLVGILLKELSMPSSLTLALS